MTPYSTIRTGRRIHKTKEAFTNELVGTHCGRNAVPVDIENVGSEVDEFCRQCWREDAWNNFVALVRGTNKIPQPVPYAPKLRIVGEKERRYCPHCEKVRPAAKFIPGLSWCVYCQHKKAASG